MKRALSAVSFVSVVAIAGAGAAAAATTLRSTWRAPDAQPGTFRGKKVVALFVSPDEQERRGVEGLLADELTKRGARVCPRSPSYPSRRYATRRRSGRGWRRRGSRARWSSG